MPTIDQLDPAQAAADDDLLPISRGGRVMRASRAQMVAGLQPALALAPGTLLGRSSAGLGPPERIGLGGNLRLQGGVLSGAAPFAVAALPLAGAPAPGDLLPLSQAGQDGAVTYGAVMAGLGGLRGINLSGHQATAPGGIARDLQDWVAEAVTPEAFGAAGDGVRDDTDALDRATATGRPVRLAARTYAVRGGWTVARDAVLTGVPGRSVLRRIAVPGVPAGGAFINVAGAAFTAVNVVFDGAGVPGDSWGVLVQPGCTRTLFEGCVFQGAVGPSLGSGLVIQARDGALDGVLGGPGGGSRHQVLRCEARDNQVHGIWVQAAAGALVQGCLAHGNGAYGICLDFNDPAFKQAVRHGRVLGNECWGNGRGISVGNFNETNLEPPRWGHANPDAADVVVSGNVCHGNQDWGIAVSGRGMLVLGNALQGNGSGILCNAAGSRVAGNAVSGPGYFGIDAGGSDGCDVTGNLVQGCAVGINPGGSRNVLVAGNQMLGNVWGVTAYDVESDGHGTPFGIPCRGLVIEGNRIVLRDGSGGGVALLDGVQGAKVARNAMFPGAGSLPVQALNANTDAVLIEGNTWDNQAAPVVNPSDLGAAGGGVQQLQVPDLLDGVMVTAAPRGVDSMAGQHQASMAGRIAFVRVAAGGSGYTRADVVIAGTGQGAQAAAWVRDGAVIGITIVDGGAGYGGGPVTVTVRGDGQEARAVASAGLPVPQGRRLRLHCNAAVRFRRAGSSPFQDNWTQRDMLVPAATAVDWTGAWGGWQAVRFTAGDFLTSAGDGSATLRSPAGDLVLRPGGGRVRVASDDEPTGFVSGLGHGSPEGVVAAPPGSDYRNLDGGAGATLWIKQSGAGAAGWAAVG